MKGAPPRPRARATTRRRTGGGLALRFCIAGTAAAAPAGAAPGLAAQEPVSVPAGASVDTAAWLAGCWVADDGDRRTEEIWMVPAGGVMVGMGRARRPGRPASWEQLLIRERDGVLTYTALPSGQSLTHFPLVAAEPGRLRFENPGHDFPRALEYRRPVADSLQVHVFDDPEDPEPAFSVRFARDSCPP